MHKSLFRKYFSVSCFLLAVSFIVLSTVILVSANLFWRREQQSLLSRNVHTVSAFLSKDSSSEIVQYSFMVQLLYLLGNTVDADLFITDAQGTIIICNHTAENEECYHQKHSVSQDLIKQLGEADYAKLDTLGDMFREPHYIVGTPVLYDGNIVGSVFASVPSTELRVFLGKLFRMLIWAVVIVFALCFVIIYMITSQMTRPLRTMAQAARNMAKGDFFTKVPETNRQDEIGELTTAFNNMTMSLASLEQMRRSFISNVSHELKTPMTTIAGFIDGILDGTISPDKQKQYLQIVSGEVKRLSRLVASMLNLSRLEAGETELRPERFNITELLLRTILSFEQIIEEKQISILGLEDTVPLWVYADSDLIHQVIYNLSENAIKFTPQNGWIRFETGKEDKNCFVTITNSGDGLSRQELSHIFERFYKTDKSRAMDKTGIGLGLYIVQTIIGIHGGSIIADSVEGESTTIGFSLPAREKEADKRNRGKNPDTNLLPTHDSDNK